MAHPYVITLQLTQQHGWGMIGVHLALHLLSLGRAPLLTSLIKDVTNPDYLAQLKPLEASVAQFQSALAQRPDQMITSDSLDVIHGAGNDFQQEDASRRLWGKRNICMIFFEDQVIDERFIATAERFDAVVTGSTYNYNLLKSAGYGRTELSFQGIDPLELIPKKKTGRFGDRFVVFSGGKVEYRKGQDLVLKAFKEFHGRYPDSVLVTNWINFWPAVAETVNESDVLDVPLKPHDGADYIRTWALENGLAPDAFVDLGRVHRHELSQLFAECDVAVFPNRCEGGTNLVCNETMFCRVPTILSANTGHLDMMPEGKDVCIALKKQTPLSNEKGNRTGWMESDVDEIVAALEWVYHHPDEAKAMARRAFQFVGRERTWQKFAKECVAVFDKV